MASASSASATSAAASAAPMSFDLTSTISQYLDRHLVLVLVNFLEEQALYPAEDVLRVKLDVLSKTKMVDLATSILTQLNPDDQRISQQSEKRAAVVSQLKALQEQCKNILQVVENTELVEELRENNNFNLSYLKQHHQITEAHVDHLYTLARFKFECGIYGDAADYLFYFVLLSHDEEKKFQAAWGQLAAEIILESEAEPCLAHLNQLRDLIENKQFASPVLHLQQRTWLIHWSLFVYFNHESIRGQIIDFLMNEKYLNTIQTSCPHILRYLTAAAIINKSRRRNIFNELVSVIEQEQLTYSDPITDFLRLLYVDFNFDAAHQKLKECEKVCKNDYFLSVVVEEFMDNARNFFFETYFKIHKCIDTKSLAKRLEMNEDDAERWIVNLIRSTKVSAKIDSQADQLMLANNFPSIYQQVIDKTKLLTARTQQLMVSLERRTKA